MNTYSANCTKWWALDRIVGSGICGVSQIESIICGAYCACTYHISTHTHHTHIPHTYHTHTHHKHTHTHTHTHTHICTQEIDPSVLDADEIPNDDLGKNQSELHLNES